MNNLNTKLTSYVEEWRPIEGFENYLVSDQGRVMNAKTGRILKPHDNGNGYYQTQLWKNNKPYNKRVNRLVADAFIPNPEGLKTVNHINEIKTDNRVTNLEWMSHADNVRYSLAKPVNQYDYKTGELLASYPSVMEVERLFGYKNSNICKCCNGHYKKAYGYIWDYVSNTESITDTSDYEYISAEDYMNLDNYDNE